LSKIRGFYSAVNCSPVPETGGVDIIKLFTAVLLVHFLYYFVQSFQFPAIAQRNSVSKYRTDGIYFTLHYKWGLVRSRSKRGSMYIVQDSLDNPVEYPSHQGPQNLMNFSFNSKKT